MPVAEVRFTRTGERRYRVEVERDDGSVLHMPRGPGFDPWLPHDLLHFVVERHFGIRRGVFGQLAGGGDAGTFFTIPHHRRDPARRLSMRLATLGRDDMARSERLTAACMVAWNARRAERWEFTETVAPAELTELSDALMAELDEVARRWHRVQIGRALTLCWPADLTASSRKAPQERRVKRERALPPQRRRIA